MILGEITKENISLEFLNMDLKEFKEINMDISDILSEEELIEKINELELSNNIFYKINLIGKRNFEINIYNLYKFILNENIIKLKDKTQINIDINKIANEINLRGLFLNEILEDEKNNIISSEQAEKIIEIGLNVLK